MITKHVQRQVTAYLNDVQIRLKELFNADVFLTAKEIRTGQLVAPYSDDAWHRLETAVAEHYGTTWQNVLKGGRKSPFPEIRACFCYIGTTFLPYKSLNQIKQMIGVSHHTTVLHCVEKFEGYLRIKDKDAIAAVQNITALLSLRKHESETH